MNTIYKNTIVVGSNSISNELIHSRINPEKSCHLIKVRDNVEIETDQNIIFYNGINSINNILAINKIESIFYCFESFNKEEILLVSEICRTNNLNLYIVSRKEAISQKSFLDLRNIDQLFLKKPIIYLFIKRILDIIISIFAVIVLLPIFCIISILIPIESGFPILFTQNRVGAKQKIFLMYKFRSIFNSKNKYEVSPSEKRDKRITKIGRYIRKTSLDELPQFFNVLIGSMSIVGPRPEMEFIVSEYNEFERLRLSCKPGITGLWQLSSARNQPIHYNVDYDLRYMIKSSLISDLFYMAKTLLFGYKGI